MDFLYRYFDFICESAGRNEMRLHYSKEFRDLLTKISKNINWVKLLLAAEDSNQISDTYTLIDVTDKNDTISFIQANRILRSNPDLKKYPDSDIYFLPRSITNNKSNELWTKGRTEIGIGRWSRRVILELHKSSISDSEMEKFVNLYKATFDGSDSKFEIVKGDEIKKWYLYSNYEVLKGQLGNSCMRSPSCQDFFDIYTKNPEVCSLLIMRSERDKEVIVGRSLLWNLTNGKKYQDRIYTIRDSDKLLFEEWAEKNDYLTFEGYNKTLEVKVGEHNYTKFPYMDTFAAFSPSENLLSSDESLWPDSGYYILRETNGGFRDFNVVWSDYHSEYIPNEEAVWCENIEDYSWKDDALYLNYKDIWVFDNGDGDVVFSRLEGEYFYKEDVVFSDVIDDYIYKDSPKNKPIEVIINERGEKDWCPESRTDLYLVVDGEYYRKDKCFKDPYTSNWVFKDSKLARDIDKKLMLEFGLDPESSIEHGIPTNQAVQSVLTDLELRLQDFKMTKEIKDEIKGLDLEERPDLEDVFNILKSYLSISTSGLTMDGNYSYRYLTNLINKFNLYKKEDVSILIAKLNQSGDLPLILKMCIDFDKTLLPEDIYKRWLFVNM